MRKKCFLSCVQKSLSGKTHSLPDGHKSNGCFDSLSGVQQVKERSWSSVHWIKDGKLCSVVELGEIRKWRGICRNNFPNASLCFRKVLSAGVPSKALRIYAVEIKKHEFWWKIRNQTFLELRRKIVWNHEE